MTMDFTTAVIAPSFLLLIAGMVCSFVRIVRGPSLADKVVALDMITALMVCFAGVFAIVSEQEAFLDVAIALALIGFLGTVAFARYAERQHGLAGKESLEGEQQND